MLVIPSNASLLSVRSIRDVVVLEVDSRWFWILDLHKWGKRHRIGMFSYMELDGQSLDIWEKFCYLWDSIGAKWGAVDFVLGRISNGWSNCSDLLPLLTSRRFSIGKKYWPLEAKVILYSACVYNDLLSDSETWSVKEEDPMRLEISCKST